MRGMLKTPDAGNATRSCADDMRQAASSQRRLKAFKNSIIFRILSSGTSSGAGARCVVCRCIHKPKAIGLSQGLVSSWNFSANTSKPGLSASRATACAALRVSSFCCMALKAVPARCAATSSFAAAVTESSNQRWPLSQLLICGTKRPCSRCQLSVAMKCRILLSILLKGGNCPWRFKFSHAARARPLASFLG